MYVQYIAVFHILKHLYLCNSVCRKSLLGSLLRSNDSI